jgi:predicted HAD superfamily phosphohydrolase YqeG
VKAGLVRVTGLAEAVRRAGELSARTMIFDIEPLVAYWDTSQEALDRGIARVLDEVATVPGVQVVCFATNSARRPSVLPGGAGPGPRVVYVASAGKPARTAAYRDFPRPGVVIGDQVATDGILARRLGYAFVLFDPQLAGLPAGPRLMGTAGRLVRPLLFTHAD